MSEERPEQQADTQVESKADRLYRQAYGDPRPKPDFTMDPLHLFLLLTSALTTIGLTVLIALRIPEMPDQIPVHFDFIGEATRYGSPWTSLWVTGGMTLMALAMAWISFTPHWFNYPYMITAENAQRAYRTGQQLMVQSTAAVAVSVFGSASIWLGWGLGWLIPVGAALLLAVCVVGIIRCFRAR
ncbi:DUF1648 domain-containing protein [Nesterenkonia ebinurensis]|uniref:DUF1648 domain-containing protein n=1 Tax=Nesterenkonia ebinurensis TaxID=2608252 RepID=UPI00123E1203|nr:DUF1648 domain-containing protein [Nesterenkonia ebinurensis]